ncbi:FtsK/SpoIIIE family DNA translocase [Daejeonella lutea]|uniref:DNA segregation ATPase FtsK/SpoIIIE, S-DNA-T family n=1 Tax=Daejeonella lutea TaxID=572036 RepID=A0A1T5AUV5_9SPHI|nr:DNA translocase FtsK [Daejeonella lutea]SKB38587.1 DNA segregation ATPase FtsK/SpoIIIE, S-DNA-T family [Daejeonella lutea]
MPLRGNQFRNENSFRDEPKSKPTTKSRISRETADVMPKFKFNDDRAIKIIGLFFLIVSLYFMIAFTSYLFTWKDDQSYVLDANGGWGNLWKTQAELIDMGLNQPVVENWLGKFGALLSHQFIYEWFGVASFLFIGVFFIVGYRMLFKIKVLSISKTLSYSFFLLIFISVTLGFFHAFLTDYPHYLEGEFGFWTNRLLQAQIGNAGIAGLLAFAGLTALIIAYNIDFKIPERSREPKYVVPETSENIELEEEVRYEPVEFNLPNRSNSENGNSNKVSQNLPPLQPIEPDPDRHVNVVLSPSRNVPMETAVAVVNEIKETPPLTIEVTEEEKKSSELVEQFGMYDPTLDLSSYKYPPLDLLENYGSNKIAVNAEELEANKNKIVETLNHYNIEIDKIKATIGPTVTLYEIIPAPGVRISKIKNLEDDIALSLAALGIRIIAPMPGKGTIGIEVPNQHPEMVSMRSVLATEKFQNTTMDLPIALGKTISNEVYIADLSKMPHLLVAGATGQGKSVGINAILVSLLYKMHPSQLKFVLVDPKKVELTLFRKIERHFLAKLPGEEDAIITDTKKVIATLNSLCIEMDQRYDLLKNAHVRNLKEYNQKFISRKLNPNDGHRFLPFIVLIIDEFADLMMTAGKEVETPIARIAQLARAVGIHLVIATQRPSVNIITGTIKANFPARLAFRVLSKIDSRTILDSGGADQLIGRGDMLLSTGSDLIRIQCAFVDTPEVEKVSDFIGAQRGYPSAFMLPEYLDENSESSMKEFDASDRDQFFEEAARLIVMHQQGSTSLIQRKLKLGYNRAGRIIDQLEAAGIVGPFEGSKAREVLIPDEYSLEQFLGTLDQKE